MLFEERRRIIQDTLLLLQENSSLFVSPEDALYFRSIAKQKAAPTIEKIEISSQSTPEPWIEPPKPPPPSNQIAAREPAEVPKENINPSKTSIEVQAPLVQQESKTSWRTETHFTTEPLNFGTLRTYFQKILPHIPILDEIPSDEMAKKIANRWKTKNQIAPISILHFGEPPLQKALLAEIGKAIDIYFGPARLIDASVIEKEKQWETFLSSQDLRHVIVCDYTLWQLPELMKYYKENPAQQNRALKDTPLFLLPDLSLYSKDPMLKRSLWKSLCLKLSS